MLDSSNNSGAAAQNVSVDSAANKAKSAVQEAVDEHFDLGCSMGYSYREAIQQRLRENAVFFRKLERFRATPRGEDLYKKFQTTHKRLVPELVQEMRGIATGAAVGFDAAFALSLMQELSSFFDDDELHEERAPLDKRKAVDGCSDYMFCRGVVEGGCLNVHNEDGGWPQRHLFFAEVELPATRAYPPKEVLSVRPRRARATVRVTALNYAGDLLGGMSAFAFNEFGVAYTLNWVGPRVCSAAYLGRNYVSRQLLTARSLEHAVAIASQPHSCGHNYQLMAVASGTSAGAGGTVLGTTTSASASIPRIANVEVSQAMYSVRRIDHVPFYHANSYRTLRVPDQIESNSTIHRERRVAELPIPKSKQDLLNVLGDQEDELYPIFHDVGSHERGELSDWTLASVFFDVGRGEVEVFRGNPKRGEVVRRFRLGGAGGARTEGARAMESGRRSGSGVEQSADGTTEETVFA